MIENFKLPEGISLEKLLQYIKASYKLSGQDKKSFSNKELGDFLKEDPSNFSRQKKFFIAVNILKEDGRSVKLTDKAEKLANFLNHERNDEIKLTLYEILKDYPLSKQLEDYIDIKGEISQSDGISYLLSRCNLGNDSRYNSGAKTFLDLMALAGVILQNSDDNYIKNHSFDTKTNSIPLDIKKPLVNSLESSKSEESLDSKQEIKSDLNINLNFQINISSIDEFERYLELLKREPVKQKE